VSSLRRYSIAVLLTLTALALGLAGRGTWGTAATYSFFLAAVMLSSWVSGLGPGIVSTILGTLAADYFLIAPLHTLTFDSSRLVQLSAFVVTAVLISSLNDARRRAVDALSLHGATLESRVRERTAELAAANEHLRGEIERRIDSERTLAERVKELTALHATGRLLNEPASPPDVLARIVELLPAAWQYPNITSARIVTGEIDVRTPSFELTPWVQRARFSTSGGRTGVIEIVYREARPSAGEGPFLPEERNLIQSLAGMLGAYFERAHAEEDRLNLARAEAAREHAEHANSAKDQFLATLSHELRSPLNVMLGWTQMLRSGQVPAEPAGRGFEILERNVRLQAQLIEDLLDVSRIVAGKLRIEKRTIDLGAAVETAVDAARPAARARKVTLTARIEPCLYMAADPQRIQQVVSNLLTNALKFTPEGGSIDVSVEHAGDGAQVRVRDTGIGIAPDLLPRMFDRFQQGDSSTTRTHGGLGLGLAIVKHLVEQHGGSVEATSDGVNRGSTFTLTLPLLADLMLAPPPRQPPAMDESLLSGVRVLVVDDEADERVTLATILERVGARPTVVGSTREALDAISHTLPDVLLSDVAMPGENGYTLIRRVRMTVDAGRLPAAALSAHADEDSKARALGAGFQTYLSKPIEPALLVAAIASLVHRSVGI
jgi:signal transduction histidine kinase/CheY-like chemotaxis protein